MGLNQIKGKIIKIAGEPKIRVINHTAYRKQLADLEPGTYEFVIQPVDSKLKQMKKAYFAMESELSRHLGYKKVQLHSQLKDYIGHHISPENGRPEYLSIARVTSEEEMMQRILELQEFAAEELNYVFEPYNPPMDTKKA
jgi:hemerythrin